MNNEYVQLSYIDTQMQDIFLRHKTSHGVWIFLILFGGLFFVVPGLLFFFLWIIRGIWNRARINHYLAIACRAKAKLMAGQSADKELRLLSR